MPLFLILAKKNNQRLKTDKKFCLNLFLVMLTSYNNEQNFAGHWICNRKKIDLAKCVIVFFNPLPINDILNICYLHIIDDFDLCINEKEKKNIHDIGNIHALIH